MKCSKCNYENPEDAAKCEKCGSLLIEVTAKLDTIPEIKTSTDPLAFSPGEKFGSRYQIIEEIGAGGMGKVFKARDLELNIVVALKMIKPELSSDPDIISRFKRELLLAREILHENVIRIHDLGEIDNIRYISMNYIKGNSLKEIIQSTGKLTIEKSIDTARQICSALQAAHQKEIVHRDLKPQNIMLDKKGNAVVLDFGIARSVTSSGETEAGIVLGTPDFISPEQIRGKKADAVSDIYSLGIIMYEMVTGQLPFRADDPTSLLYLHLHEEPVPPSKLNPQIPKKLEKIILKCLQKKKKDRYQSVEKLLEDLELEKTGQIKPIKEKKRDIPETGSGGASGAWKYIKYGLRFLLLLVVCYAALSVLSLVNDSHYRVELDKIKVEDETHYKDLFPIRKDWLPADWEKKDCDSWDTYSRLFPARPAAKGGAVPGGQFTQDAYTNNILYSPYLKKFEKITGDFDYNSAEDLKKIIDSYGKAFKLADLTDAVGCAKVDPSALLKTNCLLDFAIMAKYVEMISLQARADFLAGDTEAGVEKIHRFLLFSLDLLSSSTSLAQDRMAMTCFNKTCRELIPLLASFKLKLKHRETDLVEEESPKNEKQQVETQPQAPSQEEGFTSPLLDRIETLVTKILEKLDPREIFYKEYLSLARNSGDIYQTYRLDRSGYYLYGKFNFWRHGFSINRNYFKKGIEFYRDLFAGLRYIENPHTKSVFIIDYFDKAKRDDKIITDEIPQIAFEINAARMFGKLVVILLNLKKYSLDSTELSNLKAAAVFTNEFSEKPFEIVENEAGFFIILLEDFKMKLSITSYPQEHKQALKSFRHFDIQRGDQVRLLLMEK